MNQGTGCVHILDVSGLFKNDKLMMLFLILICYEFMMVVSPNTTCKVIQKYKNGYIFPMVSQLSSNNYYIITGVSEVYALKIAGGASYHSMNCDYNYIYSTHSLLLSG